MKKRTYTNNELMFFDKLTDELVIWLFHTNDKRHAIIETLKKAYNKGLRSGKK